MVKLVGLLVLVICVAVVLSDYSKMRDDQARAKERSRAMDEDPVRALPIVRGQNDPYMTDMQSRAEYVTSGLGAAVGGGAGAGVGRALGSAVSAAEVESARGLASHYSPPSETRDVAERSQGAGATGGQAWGANVVAAFGGFLGAIPSLPLLIAEGAVNSVGGANERLTPNLRDRGVFNWADSVGIPKL